MVTPPPDTRGAPSDPEPRQIAVYRTYLQLQSIAQKQYSGELAGHLLVCAGFDQRGAELAFATTIGGGAFLGIDPDPQRLKAAVRQGACDFMVNTLDEALRVLKNELRKRTPLSAGVLGNAAEILPAMAKRGVQPDLIAITSGASAESVEFRSALDRIVARGAKLLPLPNAELLKNNSAAEVLWTASNLQDLRRMDRIALELFPSTDLVHRRWVERAAGYFYRQKPLTRVLELGPEERIRLLDAFKSAVSSSPFKENAALHWQSSDGVEQTLILN